jgi:hypothetical protein
MLEHIVRCSGLPGELRRVAPQKARRLVADTCDCVEDERSAQNVARKDTWLAGAEIWELTFDAGRGFKLYRFETRRTTGDGGNVCGPAALHLPPMRLGHA